MYQKLLHLAGWCSGKSLDLCSGGARTSAGALTNLAEVFHGFPQSLQENCGIISLLGHDQFLPNPLRFIIRHCITLAIDSFVK
jgi:hypothetical protein